MRTLSLVTLWHVQRGERGAETGTRRASGPVCIHRARIHGAVRPGVQRMHMAFPRWRRKVRGLRSSRGGKLGIEKLEGITRGTRRTWTMTCGIMKPSSNVHWDLYLTEDRKRGHIIRMDEGDMAVRSFEK